MKSNWIEQILKKEKGPAPPPPSQSTTPPQNAVAQKEVTDEKASIIPKSNDDRIVDLLQRNEVAATSARTVVDESDSMRSADSADSAVSILNYKIINIIQWIIETRNSDWFD